MLWNKIFYKFELKGPEITHSSKTLKPETEKATANGCDIRIKVVLNFSV